MYRYKIIVTVHSAKGLKEFKDVSTMNPYVDLWITNNGINSEFLRTIIKVNEGSDPVWEKVIEFVITLDPSMLRSYQLVCDINHKGTLVDRIIGQVKVSFEHFFTGESTGHMISYPVVRSFGKIKGEIIISHEIKEILVGIPNPIAIQLTEMANVNEEVPNPTTKKAKKINRYKALKHATLLTDLTNNCVSIVNNSIQILSKKKI